MDRLEEMLKIIAGMRTEDREAAIKSLREKLGDEIADKIAERIFYIKLYTDPDFYKATMNKIGTDLYAAAHN